MRRDGVCPEASRSGGGPTLWRGNPLRLPPSNGRFAPCFPLRHYPEIFMGRCAAREILGSFLSLRAMPLKLAML